MRPACAHASNATNFWKGLPARTKRNRFSSVIILTLALFYLVSSISHCASSSEMNVAVTALSAKVASLQSQVTTLSADQAKLLQKLSLSNIGQGSLLAVGISTGNVAGSQIKIPVSFLAGPVPASGIQVDIVAPASFTVVGFVAGPAATAAGKGVSTNIVGQTAHVIVFGINQTRLLSGVVATMTLQSTAAAKGTSAINVLNGAASDADGNTVLLTQTSGLVGIK